MGFQMSEKLWLLDGASFKVYGKFDDTYAVKDVTEIAYVPTTSIARGAASGGTSFENVNLLQPKRKNSFLAKKDETTFQLDASEITEVLEVKVLDKSGEWVVKTVDTDYTG